MRGVGRGRARVTRQNTLVDMEERNPERTKEFEPPPNGAMAAESEEKPVVRPKVNTAHAVSEELSAPLFFEEMREFMHPSDKLRWYFFEQIKQLRSEMVPKDGLSEEHFKQPVQYYPFSEPAGVPRLQAGTPTLLLTDEKPKKKFLHTKFLGLSYHHNSCQLSINSRLLHQPELQVPVTPEHGNGNQLNGQPEWSPC